MSDNLESYFKALPEVGRALILTSLFNSSLIESLNYLFRACEEVFSPSLFNKVTEKINSLNPQKKLSSRLNVLHSDLASSVQSEDVERVEIIANKLVEDNFEVSDFEFINIDHLDSYYTPLIKNICKQEVPEKVEFYPLLQNEFEHMKAETFRGLNTIKDVCPDYFEEATSLINEILFLKAERLRHGSSLNSFGLIYRNYFFRWEHLTDTIDIIIHELSHIYLFLLNMRDSIIVNSMDLHDSPLRVDKRPLIGIYHAAFVLARVIDVLTKCIENDAIPKDERTYCCELIEAHRTRFQMGMSVLNIHAQMTPLGQALIVSASQLVEESYAASATGAAMPRAVR